MPRFLVTVNRTVTLDQFVTIEVEAETPSEAEADAREKSQFIDENDWITTDRDEGLVWSAPAERLIVPGDLA